MCVYHETSSFGYCTANEVLDDVKGGEAESGRIKSDMKHQAILAMDMATWEEIIRVLELKEPMIPHREEHVDRGPGARGWYS